MLMGFQTLQFHSALLIDVWTFKERSDGASYFDAQVLEIRRRMHDIRGCRCVFLIRYNHDDYEASVQFILCEISWDPFMFGNWHHKIERFMA